MPLPSFWGSLAFLGLWPPHSSPCLRLHVASLCVSGIGPVSCRMNPAGGSDAEGSVSLVPSHWGPRCPRGSSLLTLTLVSRLGVLVGLHTGSSFPATLSWPEGVTACPPHRGLGAGNHLPEDRRSMLIIENAAGTFVSSPPGVHLCNHWGHMKIYFLVRWAIRYYLSWSRSRFGPRSLGSL